MHKWQIINKIKWFRPYGACYSGWTYTTIISPLRGFAKAHSAVILVEIKFLVNY